MAQKINCSWCGKSHQLTPTQLQKLVEMAQEGTLHVVSFAAGRDVRPRTQVVSRCLLEALVNRDRIAHKLPMRAA